jgi:hypothetical protein
MNFKHSAKNFRKAHVTLFHINIHTLTQTYILIHNIIRHFYIKIIFLASKHHNKHLTRTIQDKILEKLIQFNTSLYILCVCEVCKAYRVHNY